MEFAPSEPQAFCVATRASGASDDGRSVVPLTPVHTARDCEITCSISVSRPLAVWFCVRTVIGLVPSVVLHRTARLPTVLNWCARTGQAEPPDTATVCRTSGTI